MSFGPSAYEQADFQAELKRLDMVAVSNCGPESHGSEVHPSDV